MGDQQSLEVLIKIIADLKDGDLTIRQQKELEKAVKAVGEGADLTMRQMRALEQAAQKAGAASMAMPQAEDLARRARVLDELKKRQAQPEPEPEEKESSHGSQYAMRRHFGAVAGQILGMPGLGMMAAVGGTAAAIGVATLAVEKLVNALGEYEAKIKEIEQDSQAFETIGQRVETLSMITKELTHHNALFAASYAHIAEQFNTVQANLSRLNALTDVQTGLEDKLLQMQLKRNLAQVDAGLGMPEFEKTRRKLELEEEFERRREEREIKREQRRVAEMVKSGDEALARERKAIEDKAAAEGEIKPLRNRANIDAARQQSVGADADKKLGLLNEAQSILRQFAEGKGSAGLNMSLLGVQSSLRDHGIDLGLPYDLSKRTGSAGMAAKALEQIGGIDADGKISGFIGQQITAKSNAANVASESANKLKLAEERLAHAEKLINDNKTTYEQLKADANAKAAQIEELKRSIEELRGPRSETKDFNIQHGLQNGISPMPRPYHTGSISTDHGGQMVTLLHLIERHLSPA